MRQFLIGWKIKTFKTREAQLAWIAKNSHRRQIVEIFVNNGFAVEYRNLRIL